MKSEKKPKEELLPKKGRGGEDTESENSLALMSITDRLAMQMGELGTKEGQIIQGQIVGSSIKRALTATLDNGDTVMDALVVNMLAPYLEGKRNITPKDMVNIQKLAGEAVSKSQSVNVKATLNPTDEFLSQMAHGKGKNDK